MRLRSRSGPYIVSFILGAALFVLTGMKGVSDFFFCIGSGFLVVGIVFYQLNIKKLKLNKK